MANIFDAAVSAKVTVQTRRLGPTTQVRHKWVSSAFTGFKNFFKKGEDKASQLAPELDNPKARAEHLSRASTSNKTAKGSIFEDELDTPQSRSRGDGEPGMAQSEKTKENMAIVTDPDPRARVRWQRRKVIQMVRNRGVITREERIKMSEREHLHKSKFLPTSTKKLVMLSRQIAGKSVDDAITQMQWSKKKMAAEVKYYLEEARDLAIAQRGMGLGHNNGEIFEKPRKIQTKDGRWIEIIDPTRMYVAQSWVGRGPWRGRTIDYKARGRTGIMKHPSTSEYPLRHFHACVVGIK